MNASNRPLLRPIQHLESPNAEMWMGLIDGIYAIAMTLIAIELPELASQLIGTINQKAETTTISGLLIYELVAYTATFLILYELWSFHKSILKLSGIRHARQNLINGLILALTCLGAGNIILILKSKTELASEEITSGMSQATIFKYWINHETTTSICMLLLIASMFGLMSLLARTKANPKQSSSLKALERNTRNKAFLFLLLPLNWLPLLIGGKNPFAPIAIMILAYIAFSHMNGARLGSRLREAFKRSF